MRRDSQAHRCFAGTSVTKNAVSDVYQKWFTKYYEERETYYNITGPSSYDWAREYNSASNGGWLESK